MYYANIEEEEEEAEEEEKEKEVRKGKVTLLNFNPNDSIEGRAFSFRSDFNVQETELHVKDWKQIAFDFLNNSNDVINIGPDDFYDDLDTTRASEFVAGQGATNWGEIRRKAIESSKELKRRSKK